jgi:hypothetical protein
MIEGQEHLKSYIIAYYKSLFRATPEKSFSMDESQTADIPQVSVEKNNFLSASYTKKEV